MSTSGPPLIQFGADGDQAPILSYNIPQPTSHPTKATIAFDYPTHWFSEAVTQKPRETLRETVQKSNVNELATQLRESLREGIIDQTFFSQIDSRDPVVRTGFLVNPAALAAIADRSVEPIGDGGVVDVSTKQDLLSEIQLSDYVSTNSRLSVPQNVNPQRIVTEAERGRHLVFRPSLSGDYIPDFVPEAEQPRPQLALVERHQLSSFLGNYGAGRTIKTFSLFPGEQTEISIRTYSNSTRKQQEASSILESVSRESALEFERAVESEQSTKTASQRESESYWKVSADVGANILIASADIHAEGGGRTKTNASREEAARNTARALDKHAQSASAKREVNVNTEAEFETTTGEESSTKRTIENVNQGRTLNLVFRQMNQEFTTLLHLVDVRVAFTNGFPDSYREVPLYRLDELLEEVIVEGEVDGVTPREVVEEQIMNQLTAVADYKDTYQREFVEEAQFEDDPGYWRVNKDLRMTYEPPEQVDGGVRPTVRGVILSGTTNTLRTDGVIVDALLGRGEALEEAGRRNQSQESRRQKLANDQTEESIRRQKLARSIVEDETDGDTKAERFAKVFGHPPTGEEL